MSLPDPTTATTASSPAGDATAQSAAPQTSPVPSPARPRTRTFALLGSELALVFRRRRTWAMLGALGLVPILIAVAVRLTTGGDSGGPAFLGDITNNGLFVSFTALTVSIPLFLPLTVGVVAGDTVAGEASHGTLRYLLVAPTGRLRFMLVKYVGAVAFCLAATVVIVLVGAAIGALLFPIGPVTLLSGTQVDGWSYAGRAVLLALYVTLSMLGLSAIGLFASSLTNVPVGAMAATVVLAGASQVLDQLPQLDWLHPFLFSHQWLGFGDLLRDPIAFDSFGSNALLQLGYVAVFGTLAYARFASKDVLS
ncbi:ABC transporter permease [Curtobacterium sp. Leaf183]|uniref:ABC transporter permease n=1 Tax=Curtobacterium sp. Leaf183 TaxID=1736291 RepID=UPI0006F8B711|nr:ABC transporter permease [Curtobacterium sp. Leaf183]KQS14604.1 ABC transporter permease [Curtobacterium sp. Leaf183]